MSKRRMVFDVESIGLDGEGWAAGFAVYNGSELVREAWGHCHPDHAAGCEEGRAWVRENCRWAYVLGSSAAFSEHGIPDPQIFYSPGQLRGWFWRRWVQEKSLEPSLQLWADVPWPVEARFLIQCVEDHRGGKTKDGVVDRHNLLKSDATDDAPFPLYDVCSYVESIMGNVLEPKEEGAASLSPTQDYAMAHHPLLDAKVSARRLFRVEEILNDSLWRRA